MTRIGAVGLTLPWGRVYLLRQWYWMPWLRRHELVHLHQIRRDGPVWFTIRYFWWLALFGYRRNPYEAEAYAIASPETITMGGYNAPPLPETVKMPAPGDQASLEAQRQAQNQLIGLQGRESTNLSGQNGSFIGDVIGTKKSVQPASNVSYSNTALGK